MATENYYDGLNKKLFDLIPKTGKKILELGCANGQLGRAFKAENSSIHWTGLDFSKEAILNAEKHLDEVLHIDLNKESILEILKNRQFDVVVIGDLLEHLINPEQVLSDISEVSANDAIVVCCIPNMAHYSVIQRLLTGDITYDSNGLLDKTHLRFFSPSSSIKMFLDSGWLPDLRDGYYTGQAQGNIIQGLLHVTTALNIPNNTAMSNLHLYQMIFQCRKRVDLTKVMPRERLKISVIVPVNREWEADLNIARSPGLKEMDVELIIVRDAKSAAEAFETGRKMCKNDWILYMHQDVYIPKNSGISLSRLLLDLEHLDAKQHGTLENFSLLGFAGIGVNQSSQFYNSGLLVDRKKLFSNPPADVAISVDEFAVVMRKNSRVHLDSQLGWHTWATDLCLQAYIDNSIDNAKIVNIPLFHNSVNDYNLPDAYHASSKILKQKYPQIPVIKTLCGDVRN